MAGLVPAIHVLELGKIRGWPGLRPAMTKTGGTFSVERTHEEIPVHRSGALAHARDPVDA